MIRYIEITSRARTEFIDITGDVREMLRIADVRNGVCHLFVLHTTAGITVNEGADLAVRSDISRYLDKMVPNAPYFSHSEGIPTPISNRPWSARPRPCWLKTAG